MLQCVYMEVTKYVYFSWTIITIITEDMWIEFGTKLQLLLLEVVTLQYMWRATDGSFWPV